jgi:hypothetical protein
LNLRWLERRIEIASTSDHDGAVREIMINPKEKTPDDLAIARDRVDTDLREAYERLASEGETVLPMESLEELWSHMTPKDIGGKSPIFNLTERLRDSGFSNAKWEGISNHQVRIWIEK